MSATFPSQDDLRIPAKPRPRQRVAFRPSWGLWLHQGVSAGAGFALAWGLTALLIG